MRIGGQAADHHRSLAHRRERDVGKVLRDPLDLVDAAFGRDSHRGTMNDHVHTVRKHPGLSRGGRRERRIPLHQ